MITTTAKFAHKWLGPFPIIQRVSTNAYKLTLPASMSRIHPVFSVGLLRPYEPSKIEGQLQEPPAPIQIDNKEEFEVAEILNRRRRGKKVEYLVSWKGYGPEEDSWEPANGLKNAQELVNEFNQKYPTAEKDYRQTRRVK